MANVVTEHDIDAFLAAPPVAEERLIVDFRGRSTASQEAESPWPKTAVFNRRRGERWVYDLPPGVHVPCETIGRGTMIQGCSAQFALSGCEETDRSTRQLALAPEQLLKRFAVRIEGSPVTPHEAVDREATNTNKNETEDAGMATAINEAGEAPGTVGRVKFIVTRADKEHLAQLGYTPEQIFNMRPAEADEIITAGTRAPHADVTATAAKLGTSPIRRN